MYDMLVMRLNSVYIYGVYACLSRLSSDLYCWLVLVRANFSFNGFTYCLLFHQLYFLWYGEKIAPWVHMSGFSCQADNYYSSFLCLVVRLIVSNSSLELSDNIVATLFWMENNSHFIEMCFSKCWLWPEVLSYIKQKQVACHCDSYSPSISVDYKCNVYLFPFSFPFSVHLFRD